MATTLTKRAARRLSRQIVTTSKLLMATKLAAVDISLRIFKTRQQPKLSAGSRQSEVRRKDDRKIGKEKYNINQSL